MQVDGRFLVRPPITRDDDLKQARATFIAARSVCAEFDPSLKKAGDFDLKDPEPVAPIGWRQTVVLLVSKFS